MPASRRRRHAPRERLRKQARAVVIGGGVGGASILYWLARLGWTDLVLVERARVTSGSTFHSAGLVGQLRGSLSLTQMMMNSVDLYRALKDEVGLETGWHEVGSLRLASNQERMEELTRQAAWAKTFGLPLEIISSEEAQRMFPPMSTEGVLGAAFLPTDGYIDPSQLTFALAEGARRRGAEIHPNTRVTGINVERGGVAGVETDKGRIEAEVVVNAGSMVAPELENSEVVRLINGPEAFTPDGEFILGESDVRGFWVAAGFCAHGLAGAGGMGQLVAEWIVEGVPSLDVWEMDSRRFGRHYTSREYTLARTVEIYSTYYDVKYPGHEREAGRPLRLSPTYPRLQELSATFGEKSGWERANWFEPNAARGDESLRPRGWAGHLRSPAIGAEHIACRETAALFDETSFAKIEVAGEGSAEFLEHRCDNRVARDVGAVTYTELLQSARGIACGCTVRP